MLHLQTKCGGAMIPPEVLFELLVVTFLHAGGSALSSCCMANRQIHTIITSTLFVTECLTRLTRRHGRRPPLEGLWVHPRFALRKDIVDALYAASPLLSTYTIDVTLGNLKRYARTHNPGYTRAYSQVLSRVVDDDPFYNLPGDYMESINSIGRMRDCTYPNIKPHIER